MSRSRRVIRVYPDYSATWPLWESTAENNTPTPADLGLSSELEADIRRWFDFWEVHFHWERGWDSDESQLQSAAAGKQFVAQLRKEVASFADVDDTLFG